MKSIHIKIPDNEYLFILELFRRFPNAIIETENDIEPSMVNEDQQKMIKLIDKKTKSEDYKDWSEVRNNLVKKYGL
jgi:hypothetical protein